MEDETTTGTETHTNDDEEKVSKDPALQRESTEGKGEEKIEGENLEGEDIKGEQIESLHVESKQVESEHVEGEHTKGKHMEGELIEDEQLEGEHKEVKHMEGKYIEGEHMEGEQVESEHMKDEHMEGEHMEGEHMEGEHMEGDHMEGEHMEGEHLEGEGKEQVLGEGEELMGEFQGEYVEEEEGSKKKEEVIEEKVEEEEEAYEEPPPPDPTAPYDLSDSKEALKAPFELSPEQLAEVEQVWELYQNYTPAYSDIDGYVTEKELVYLLKSLLLMTYTPEQLQELIDYCVRPPHPQGHVNFDQFVKIVTIRQRDFPIEEEIRCAFQVYDPEESGTIDREYLRESLKLGHKLTPKMLDNFIKEVDMSNDGTIGIEDAVGTLCIDLNKDDIIMLQNVLNPPTEMPQVDEF